MAPAALQEMIHEPFGSCPLCPSSAAPPSWCRASFLARVPWQGQASLPYLPPNTPIVAMASCWEALGWPQSHSCSPWAQPVPLPRAGAL